jgi:hypothetical protein
MQCMLEMNLATHSSFGVAFILFKCVCNAC